MQDNDGERELVLGNKQLLAIFFAGTLLCGVFFAVGYVVGGNSVKAGSTTTAANTDTTSPSADGKREEPPAAGNTTASNGPASNSAPTDLTPAPAGLPSAEPHIRDNPTSSGSAPTTPTPAPPPVAAAPEPVKTPGASAYQPAPANTAATGVFISVPEPGASYVQVSATSRPSADSLVKILRDGSLPAILAASSKADLFEVLVGPYRTPFSLADAKRKLTGLGYDGTVIRKF